MLLKATSKKASRNQNRDWTMAKLKSLATKTRNHTKMAILNHLDETARGEMASGLPEWQVLVIGGNQTHFSIWRTPK